MSPDRARGDLVAVAMSGGVDSSVAAAVLLEQGCRVVGLTMQLLPPGEEGGAARGCCSLDAVDDARAVANVLGIAHYTINMREAFSRDVVDYFVSEYRRGRTPNPCIACNRHVKMGQLLNRARQLDASALATGHYARIRRDPCTSRWLLFGARHTAKDQSYALYSLDQRQLAHIMFPLGDLSKDQVRRAASRLGLPVAAKAESQEICFIEGDYRDYLAQVAPDALRPGPITDRRGRVLGQHQGLPLYTVGQRRGLGVTGSEPVYVLELDPARNALVVGSRHESTSGALEAAEVNWIVPAPACGIRAQVKVRYRSPLHPATVAPLPGRRARVVFDRPVAAVAPGQAAVFYDGELVLGGGIIERSSAS